MIWGLVIHDEIVQQYKQLFYVLRMSKFKMLCQ